MLMGILFLYIMVKNSVTRMHSDVIMESMNSNQDKNAFTRSKSDIMLDFITRRSMLMEMDDTPTTAVSPVLDSFAFYSKLKVYASTVSEQLLLSYLHSADNVYGKTGHSLPVVCLAELVGKSPRTMYTAMHKLEAEGKLQVESKATNASLPKCILTLDIPEENAGLFFNMPLCPERPQPLEGLQERVDLGENPLDSKVYLARYRDCMVYFLRGTEMLTYFIVRTVSIDIPKSKAKKNKQSIKYGKLVGVAGLMAWLPGTEKTLGKVLSRLVDKGLLRCEKHRATSNGVRVVYSYTPAPPSQIDAEQGREAYSRVKKLHALDRAREREEAARKTLRAKEEPRNEFTASDLLKYMRDRDNAQDDAEAGLPGDAESAQVDSGPNPTTLAGPEPVSVLVPEDELPLADAAPMAAPSAVVSQVNAEQGEPGQPYGGASTSEELISSMLGWLQKKSKLIGGIIAAKTQCLHAVIFLPGIRGTDDSFWHDRFDKYEAAKSQLAVAQMKLGQALEPDNIHKLDECTRLFLPSIGGDALFQDKAQAVQNAICNYKGAMIQYISECKYESRWIMVNSGLNLSHRGRADEFLRDESALRKYIQDNDCVSLALLEECLKKGVRDKGLAEAFLVRLVNELREDEDMRAWVGYNDYHLARLVRVGDIFGIDVLGACELEQDTTCMEFANLVRFPLLENLD